MLIKPNTMDSGRKISEKVRELTTIPTEIGTKESGITTFKMEMVLTITPMETSIKDSGSMEDSMEKATIFILPIEVFIKASGEMAKKKALVNSSSKINMGTLVNGKTIKKTERANTSTQMARNTKAVG